MSFDLTNIQPVQGLTPVVSYKPQSQTVQNQQKRNAEAEDITEEELGLPVNPQAKGFRKGHWTIDKFTQDGQIVAGVSDKAHAEMLKHTTWAK